LHRIKPPDRYSKKKRRIPQNTPPFHTDMTDRWSAVRAHLGEAIAAINGTIGLGLEGNPGLTAAVGADSGEILARTTGGVLASVTAGLAALGLVLEAALCIKLLLTGGKYELVTTLFAN
jgi:hypothetical protein